MRNLCLYFVLLPFCINLARYTVIENAIERLCEESRIVRHCDAVYVYPTPEGEIRFRWGSEDDWFGLSAKREWNDPVIFKILKKRWY